MEQIQQIENSFNYHDNLINLKNYQFWLLEHQITAFWHWFGISNGLYINKEDYEIRKGEVFIKPAAMQKQLKTYIGWLQQYKINWNSKENHPFLINDFNGFKEAEKSHNSREDILKMISLLQNN